MKIKPHSNMIEIKIKPLSINGAFKGRRFKTPDYTSYETELYHLLPKIKVPEGKLALRVEVGYSNKMSDIDNFLKPFIDVMQKKYDFNDNMIYRLVIDKKITKKKEEYIKFEFTSLEINKDIDKLLKPYRVEL